MDLDRFDELSRRFARRSNRRDALGTVGRGGLLAAAGAALGIRRAAAETTTCSLSIRAVVSAGPDEDLELRGVLEIDIDDDGAIDSGSFETDDGDFYDVVGQVTGRAISMRMVNDNNDVLALTGTAQQDVDQCRGAIGGTFSGPQFGSIGAWTASRRRNTNSDQGGGSDAIATIPPDDSGGSGDSGGGDSGGGDSGGGDSSCGSGVTCNGICCTPRDGYNPDQIICDGQQCTCIYSCANAGCPNAYTDVFIPTGCDDRPEATCNEFCFSKDEGDDGGDDSGGDSGAVNCNGVDCAPFGGLPAVDVWCQAECRCTYACSDVCSGSTSDAQFDTVCTQDPTALCANLGCFA